MNLNNTLNVARAVPVRVVHSVAIFGQHLMVCGQSKREKAWRRRNPGLRAHAHSLVPVQMYIDSGLKMLQAKLTGLNTSMIVHFVV